MKYRLQIFIIIFFFSLVLPNKIKAQTVKWLASTGGLASTYFQVATDADGSSYWVVDFSEGTITIGDTSFTNNGFYDNMLIAKVDANGNYVWVRENSGNEVSVRGIAVDAKGDIFITGYFSGNNKFSGFDLNTNSFFGQSFVARYDTNGNCIWVKQTSGNGGVTNYGVATDLNGDCFVTGYVFETENIDSFTLTGQANGGNAYIAKYDTSGTCLWAQILTGQSISQGVGVAVDSKGNSYMTGYMIGDTSIAGNFKLINTAYSGNNSFLIKYDTAGNCLWAVEDTGLASTNSSAIAVDQNGDIYLAGDFENGSAIFGNIKLNGLFADNSFLVKYDASGNCLWAKQSSGTIASGYSLSLDKDNNCYITGNFYNGEADFGNLKLVNNNLTAENIFVIKYDANGNPVWAIADTGSGGYCYSSSCDAEGNLYTTGDGLGGGFGSFVFNGGFLAKINTVISGVNSVKSSLPINFSLSQNYPNPFNPTTAIEYSVPAYSHVVIKVYNVLGKEVKALVDENKPAGNYTVDFNASGLASGIYFYRMQTNGFSTVRKMILLK